MTCCGSVGTRGAQGRSTLRQYAGLRRRYLFSHAEKSRDRGSRSTVKIIQPFSGEMDARMPSGSSCSRGVLRQA